jgi:homoserine kinase
LKYSVTAIAPATSANLGSGFDVFGVALDEPHDVVQAAVSKRRGVRIEVAGRGSSSIPVEPRRNTAGLVAKELLVRSGRARGLELRIEKGVLPGRGLGSSAASAAATAIAVNELLGLDLSPIELVPVAARGEVASAGAPHADNVAPSLLGYFTIVTSLEPPEVVQLPGFRGVEFAIIMPDIRKKDTASMRAVLPKRVDLPMLVYNVGRAATMAAGIALQDIELMGRGMSDAVVEGARMRLYPGIAEARRAALDAGAMGVALSGAGPSLIALVGTRSKGKAVAKAGIEAFERLGTKCDYMMARPGPGARVIDGGRT